MDLLLFLMPYAHWHYSSQHYLLVHSFFSPKK
jgi:hypothetical protein